ncbi:MAG: magnetic particle specific iron-binding protein [Rhodospirillaceae bacterium]
MATFPIGAGQGVIACPAKATAAGMANGGAIPPHVMAGAGKSMVAKGVMAGGVGCKGLSLGLGIGLGLWGPAILAGLGAAAAYTLWRSRSAVEALSEDQVEIGEALSSR